MSRSILLPFLVALASVLAGCTVPTAVGGGTHGVEHALVPSFDQSKIAITVFRPAGATAEEPVPVIVRSHGWSGSRDREILPGEAVERFLDAGYGVVAIDMRGHGESEGLARVHDPDYEMRDVAAVFDWIHDNLPWVAKQDEAVTGHAKDVVAGGSGLSYGGAWQLLFDAHDGRLDAIVPEITWSSVPQSLVPNGVVNSGWVHLLYAGGKARARLDPMIDRWYAEVMAKNVVPADAVAHFERSSVYPVVHRIDAPALLVQGTPDTLFNLNQALANYEGLRATGVPTRLFTHLGGHLLSGNLFNPAIPDVGFPQPGDKGSPCGDIVTEAILWYDEHLKGLPAAARHEVMYALDDGSCLTGDSPSALATAAEFAIGVPLVLPANAGSVVLPFVTVDERTALAGVPTLAATVTVAGADDIAFVSLVATTPGGGTRTLSSQVTPVRLPGPGGTEIALALGGVGAVLQPGDVLALRVDRQNEFFATNGGRLPSALVMDGITLGLPLAS